MHQNNTKCAVVGWVGIAGGITCISDWTLWAQGKLKLQPTLPKPPLKSVPSRISRRLGTLGRCVMSVSEQCLPLIMAEPAVITVSKHGDLPFMDKLIQTSREHDFISPTAFTYSVHNRFSSLISIFAGYHGVNGAYSSERDGFQLALAEAISLIEDHPDRQVLVVSFEPEIPETYDQIISTTWQPHVVGFVLGKADQTQSTFSLVRHLTKQCKPQSQLHESGSCLPFIKTILNESCYRDGFWEFQYDA